MRSTDIHSGDCLRIRDWQDLYNEFRVVPSSISGKPFIQISFGRDKPCFVPDMIPYCGKLIIVRKMYYGETFCSDLLIDFEGRSGFSWCAEMFEPVESEITESEKDYDLSGLFNMP